MPKTGVLTFQEAALVLARYVTSRDPGDLPDEIMTAVVSLHDTANTQPPDHSTNRDRLVNSIEVEYPAKKDEGPKISIKIYYGPGEGKEAIAELDARFLDLVTRHRPDLLKIGDLAPDLDTVPF